MKEKLIKLVGEIKIKYAMKIGEWDVDTAEVRERTANEICKEIEKIIMED
jgi:hypothetical protein